MAPENIRVASPRRTNPEVHRLKAAIPEPVHVRHKHLLKGGGPKLRRAKIIRYYTAFRVSPNTSGDGVGQGKILGFKFTLPVDMAYGTRLF